MGKALCKRYPCGSLEGPKRDTLEIPKVPPLIPERSLELPGESSRVPGGLLHHRMLCFPLILKDSERSLEVPGRSSEGLWVAPGNLSKGPLQIPERSLEVPGGSQGSPWRVPGGSLGAPWRSLEGPWGVPGGLWKILGGPLETPRVPRGS